MYTWKYSILFLGSQLGLIVSNVYTETVLLFLPFTVGFIIEEKNQFLNVFHWTCLTLRYIDLIFLWNLCSDLKEKAFYDNLNFLVFIIIIDIVISCCFEVIGCFDVEKRLCCNVLPSVMLQKRHFMMIWISWSLW